MIVFLGNQAATSVLLRSGGDLEPAAVDVLRGTADIPCRNVTARLLLGIATLIVVCPNAAAFLLGTATISFACTGVGTMSLRATRIALLLNTVAIIFLHS